MEMPRHEQMHDEVAKYQPKYMVFLGRHAEPATKSIFDQVGGEAGINCDNFEESSLTLKGVTEASLFGTDLLRAIVDRMPKGKINIMLAGTKAYRTIETAGIIKENLEKQAKELGRVIEVTFEGPEDDSLLCEEKDESPAKSKSDIDQIISEVASASVMNNENTVLLGITHEAKLRNYLQQIGFVPEAVDTAEFLSVVDGGKGTKHISFRGESIKG